eukprot:g13043.t1
MFYYSQPEVRCLLPDSISSLLQDHAGWGWGGSRGSAADTLLEQAGLWEGPGPQAPGGLTRPEPGFQATLEEIEEFLLDDAAWSDPLPPPPPPPPIPP